MVELHFADRSVQELAAIGTAAEEDRISLREIAFRDRDGHRGIRLRIPELQKSSLTVVVGGDHQGVSGDRHGAGIFSLHSTDVKFRRCALQPKNEAAVDITTVRQDYIANDAVRREQGIDPSHHEECKAIVASSCAVEV